MAYRTERAQTEKVMYRNHRTEVVIPVYNEAEFIGGVLDSLPVFVDRAYVVDDCSTDGSWEVIRRRATVSSTIASSTPDEEATPEPRLVPIRHKENKGRSGTVKTGYAEALKDDMDVVAVMDGGGQMDPAYLDRIVDPVVDGIADYAKGNRLDKPEDHEQISNWRLFGNALLTLLTRVASGYWGMTDPQNGYTAISAETLKLLELEELYDDYGFFNDVLVNLNVQGARIADIPVRARYGDEENGIQYRSFVPALSLLLLHRFLWRLMTSRANKRQLEALLYGLAALVGVAGVCGVGLAVAGGLMWDIGIIALIAFIATTAHGMAAVVIDRWHNRQFVTDFELDQSAK